MTTSIVETTEAGARFEAEDCAFHVSPGGHARGLRATVTIYIGERTDVYGVSRLEGENAWTIDSRFVNGLPSFVNGFGARYLRTERIIDKAVWAALDQLAADLHFDAALGEGRR